MEQMERKSPLSDLMRTAMEKVHEMVDTKSIVGEPIVTADGVTLIPISRVSVGFGSGGGDYGKTGQSFGGGSGAGVKIDPVAFLVIKDGVTRVMPVAVPPISTVDRVIDLRRPGGGSFRRAGGHGPGGKLSRQKEGDRDPLTGYTDSTF